MKNFSCTVTYGVGRVYSSSTGFTRAELVANQIDYSIALMRSRWDADAAWIQYLICDERVLERRIETTQQFGFEWGLFEDELLAPE